MQILDDESYNHIISWTPDGKAFAVLKPTILEEKVLPAVFDNKQNGNSKFKSFLRKVSALLDNDRTESERRLCNTISIPLAVGDSEFFNGLCSITSVFANFFSPSCITFKLALSLGILEEVSSI